MGPRGLDFLFVAGRCGLRAGFFLFVAGRCGLRARPVRCGPGYVKICGAGRAGGRMIQLRGGCGLNFFSPRSFSQNSHIVCAYSLVDDLIALSFFVCVCVRACVRACVRVVCVHCVLLARLHVCDEYLLCMRGCVHTCVRATRCRALLHVFML